MSLRSAVLPGRVLAPGASRTARAPDPARLAGAARSDALLLRLLAVAGFMCIPTAISLAYETAGLRAPVRALAAYSPERLAHGAVWTLVGSGFLVPRLAMVGPTSLFILLFFLPFALWRGARHAAVVFTVGNVVATAAVAGLVIPGAALHWRWARPLYAAGDVGVSDGLAACAAALALALSFRRRTLGLALLSALVAFFLVGLVAIGGRGHGATDVEHLVAVATGVALEALLHERQNLNVEPAP